MFKNHRLGFTLLLMASLATSLVPTLSLAKAIPSRWAARKYKVPVVGVPLRREAAATRGGCPADPVISLTPIEGITTTVSEYPTFFFSIPPLPETLVGQFKLRDGNAEVYQQKVQLRGNKRHTIEVGIFPTKLATDRDYRWSFTIECSDDDSSANLVTTGVVRRIVPNDPLTSLLKTATPQDLPEIYAEAEIWQDALMKSSILRDQAKTWRDALIKDGRLSEAQTTYNLGKQDWENLLKSVGLDTAIEGSGERGE